MSELSARSRALVASARGARLGARDRARMREGLDARLAVAAGAAVATAAAIGATSTAASASSAATAAAAGTVGAATKLGLFGKIFLACLVLGGIGLSTRAVVQRRAERVEVAANAPAIEPTVAPVAAVIPTATTEPAAQPPDAPAASADATSDAPPEPSLAVARAKAPRAKASADSASIAAEIALMREAQAALASGDPARSLEALDAASARHPSGALREERDAARVLALCSAGRVDEARAQARAFLAKTPRSVQAARVRGSCAFASPDKK